MDMYGAFYLLQVGRVEEAGEHIESALQEDPLNLLYRIQFGIYLLAAGQDAEASAHFHQVLDIDPSYPLAWMPSRDTTRWRCFPSSSADFANRALGGRLSRR